MEFSIPAYIFLWYVLNILLENDVANEVMVLFKDIYCNNFSKIRIQFGIQKKVL